MNAPCPGSVLIDTIIYRFTVIDEYYIVSETHTNGQI